MKTLKISEIPATCDSPGLLVDYMLDYGFMILLNDLGSGIEYEISDIEESWPYLQAFLFINQKN